MTRLITGFAGLAVLTVTLITPRTSEGSVLIGTGDGMIGGKEVSARFEAEVVDGKLQILLTNTGTRNDYTPAQVLTDISFNWSGPDFVAAGSSVWMPDGSTWYYLKKPGSEDGPLNVSQEWGLARDTMLLGNDEFPDPMGPFDFSVTATSFGGSEAIFADGSLGGQPGLDGTDFGLVPDPSNVLVVPLRNQDYIVDSVVITLSAIDPITGNLGSLMSDVTFSYGSEHTGITGVHDDIIPEPASLIVWSLLGALGLSVGWYRRKRAA